MVKDCGSREREAIVQRIVALRMHVKDRDLPEAERADLEKLLKHWVERLRRLDRSAA